MRKTRILMTTLAVATLAVGCGVLAACGDEEVAYTVTFDANGGTYTESATTVKVTTDKDGRIAEKPADPTREGTYTFNGYNTVKEGTGDTVTFGANGYQFKSDATVYAQWNMEYTLTLNAGEHGKFGEAATKSVTTANKKLPADLGLTADSGWKLTGWVDASENPITAETVFTADATLTAQWSAVDGIYTKDGTFLAELEETDKDTYLRQLAGVVSLEAGNEIVLKIDGKILSHTQHTSELYDNSCYGVTFNQATGIFTAVESILGTEGARPFNVYAKYWTNDNEDFGWTITIDDGEREPIVEGGAYLVGANLTVGEHTEANAWKLIKDFYIDPENGLTVTLSANSEFKIAQCKDGAIYWDSNPKYAMEEGKDADRYLSFPSTSNGKALAYGDYTITVDEDTWTFTFTPAESVEPIEPVEQFIHYYIKGGFSPNWNTPRTEEYEMTVDSANEDVYTLTIDLDANVEFMFYSTAEDADRNVLQGQVDYFNAGNSTLADGVTAITASGANYKTAAAGSYTFTLNTKTKELSVTFVASEEGGEETTPDVGGEMEEGNE